MISSKDVSIVIQGRIERATLEKSIRSLRKILPEAEIILCTWRGSSLDESLLNKVIYLEDPKGYPDPNFPTFVNNLQRIVRSTKKGVDEATRKFILKIRGDLLFKNKDFTNYFSQFECRDEKFSIFKRKIIVSSQFTKEYLIHKNRVEPTPFHMSDWFAFGLAEDVRYLCDILEPSEPESSLYFQFNEKDPCKIDLHFASHKYCPEQYQFYIACKKKFPELSFKNYLDYNRTNIEKSKQLMLHNLIVLDPWMISYEHIGKYRDWSRKARNLPRDLAVGLYDYHKYLKDYEEFLKK